MWPMIWLSCACFEIVMHLVYLRLPVGCDGTTRQLKQLEGRMAIAMQVGERPVSQSLRYLGNY